MFGEKACGTAVSFGLKKLSRKLRMLIKDREFNWEPVSRSTGHRQEISFQRKASRFETSTRSCVLSRLTELQETLWPVVFALSRHPFLAWERKAQKGEVECVTVLCDAAPSAFSSSLISSAWFQNSWAGAGECRVCKKLTLPCDFRLRACHGHV